MLIITNEKKILLQKIAKDYDLDLLILFGSQVTGKTHKESDFDIGYRSKRKLDLNEESALMFDLMPIVECRNELFMNLVNLKTLRPLFLYSMTIKVQVLYEAKENLFHSLQAYAYKSYIEMMPTYTYKLNKVLASI